VNSCGRVCDAVWLVGVKGGPGENAGPGLPGRKGAQGEPGSAGRDGEVFFQFGFTGFRSGPTSTVVTPVYVFISSTSSTSSQRDF